MIWTEPPSSGDDITAARRRQPLPDRPVMTKINIVFTRFSAFYSPLISTMSAGFLEEEGLEASHAVAAPGTSAIAALVDGSADVVQSAPSQSFGPLERGDEPPAMHFAQINEKDGFFIAGRQPDPDFTWDKLVGRKVLVDHGAQPLAMFRYACHRMGVDYDSIDALNAGGTGEIDAAFRAGEADYVHQQGPAPQQLEHDGVGHVIAAVGEAIGPCGFSSLAATREWLGSDTARSFMRAYRRARAYVNETAAADIAAAEASLFPGIDRNVLEATIRFYQELGCWTPHVEITKPAFDVTLEVFLLSGLITRHHDFSDVVAAPPGEA